MAAGSDQQSPTPKLSLNSLPFKLINHEPPGMATPPIHARAAVPFKWEEAPGKPRKLFSSSIDDGDDTTRCLDLPPRLLLTEAAAKLASNNLPSPTTVLDGPYFGRSRSLSLAKGRSSGSEKAVFGSTRWWGNMKKNNSKELVGVGVGVGVGVDFSSSNCYDFIEFSGSGDSYEGSGDSTTKVKITRLRRRSSFFGFTGKRSSNLLVSIYEGLKQVVPWKRRHDKFMSKD